MQTSTTSSTRIKWLIGIHLLIGIAPVAMHSMPQTMWEIPAMWALSSLSIAQLMLLSFWAGMGSNKGAVRAAGAVGGIAYVTLWPELAPYLSIRITEYESSFITNFLSSFCSFSAVVLLFSGMFLWIRRKGTKLVKLSQLIPDIAPTRIRYSTFNLLILMSICSVVLSLVRIAQPTELTSTGFSSKTYVGGLILMLVVFLINNLCAAWATLSLDSPWSRIVLVIGIALMLGITFAVATGNYSFSWWIFISASLIPVVSTAIVIATLLVVRSCGYRLARKEMLLGVS